MSANFLLYPDTDRLKGGGNSENHPTHSLIQGERGKGKEIEFTWSPKLLLSSSSISSSVVVVAVLQYWSK